MDRSLGVPRRRPLHSLRRNLLCGPRTLPAFLASTPLLATPRRGADGRGKVSLRGKQLVVPPPLVPPTLHCDDWAPDGSPRERYAPTLTRYRHPPTHEPLKRRPHRLEKAIRPLDPSNPFNCARGKILPGRPTTPEQPNPPPRPIVASDVACKQSTWSHLLGVLEGRERSPPSWGR